MLKVSLYQWWRCFIFLVVGLCIFSSPAGSAGITIPANSSLNVNSGSLNVSGNITNSGTLLTTTGSITLSGNWDNSAGTFTAGTGAVTFNGSSVTQTLNSGGVSQAFYNLTHNGSGTVQMSTNPIKISGNFDNESGTFDTNSLDMTVVGNWTNKATFTPGSDTVTLSGTNQTVHGTTTFYNFNKTVTAADTLTLDDTGASAAGQTISHHLTLSGQSGNLLSLRSTTSGTYAKISLSSGGVQTISSVDVKDSDASGGLTLIAGSGSTNSGHNLNWTFSTANFIWSGATSTDWNTASNWNEGSVPTSAGTVEIPQPPPRQPVLPTDATISGLTLDAGSSLTVGAGKNLGVTGSLNASGTRTQKITLRSGTTNSNWTLSLNSAQMINAVDVEDSSATKNVTCFNCTNSGNNNSNWSFQNLIIQAPDNNTTVGQLATIIGLAPSNATITFKDVSGNQVATTTSDTNGRFRTVVGGSTQLAAGSNSLTPYYSNFAGYINSLTVVASPTTSQVPTLTSPAANARLTSPKPTVSGQGSPGQTVTVVALAVDPNNPTGSLVVTDVATGTVGADGSYSLPLTTALPGGTDYLSVTVGQVVNGALYGTASNPLVTVSMADPYGTVFNSSTDALISSASVYLYKSNGQLAQPGTDISSQDSNPAIADANGFYSFFAIPGDYYIVIDTGNVYGYPSNVPLATLSQLFTERTMNSSASFGKTFTIGNAAIQADQPLDQKAFLLRIEKGANKDEVHIGDVLTYTVTIQNISSSDVGNSSHPVELQDQIPPGFKYIGNRELLDGLPNPNGEPTGHRPLLFNIGTVSQGATRTLKYQLVVGSGVSMGKYHNVAAGVYGNTGVVISNNAEKTVRVVMDPLFDLGTVIGKVFYDLNENGAQDTPQYDATEGETIVEKSVPNVQLVMEDGTVVTTDRDGKFSIPGLLPGRHILRVDERTLPPGSYLTTLKSVIFDVTQGAVAKVNFGINIDNAQLTSKDAQFFNEKIRLTQDHNAPKPRLNAALFNPSKDTSALEEILMYNGIFVRPMEFRIFTNYMPFIDNWRLDILDADTKKLIKRFEGSKFDISNPIFWDGRDNNDNFIRSDHRYAYAVSVADRAGSRDTTKEKPLTIRVLSSEDDYNKEKKKDEDPEELKILTERYHQWLLAQKQSNNLDHQLIHIQGETLLIDPQGQQFQSVRVLKDGHLFVDIPVGYNQGLTAQDLMQGQFNARPADTNLEVILPNGDYTLDVVGANTPENSTAVPTASTNLPTAPQIPTMAPSRIPAPELGHYTRQVKVGDDYLMFVALGDLKSGYNIVQGHIEPVETKDRFTHGFWQEGKAAYYLKGKILGKYLITSSFDTDRQQKAMFRQLDPNTYYPIYGDKSSINYDATDTKGPLYLLVEWDKSSAIIGNYAVDLKDTEFSSFSRSYYGGKIDYQSVATNPYGDARTKLVVFHAQVQEKPDHNEFLATGGSLYFLKHNKVVEGSDKIVIQVRDKITGLVLASRQMKNGADYELDEGSGRLLFWQPIAMIAKSESIISSDLLNGNPVYMVADYEYEVQDKLNESSKGIRVAQAVGNNVVVGGTYIREVQADKNFQLKGLDTTVHLGPQAKVQAEAAQTFSQGVSTYVSTDGGITFTDLTPGNSTNGIAYGIKGDARLFDRIGLASYYKWIDNGFTTADTINQQGKELGGLALTFDLTPVTRLTFKQDVQKLIDNGNAQTQAQVGATETSVTMAQIVHEANRLKLTGEYQLTQVKQKIDGFTTKTNQESANIAGKAEYQLTNRLKVSLEQQVDVKNPDNAITTAGVEAQVTDRLRAHATEAFSKQGTATTVGATTNVTDKLALNTDYTVTNKNNGEVDKTATIGAEAKVNNKITTAGSVAVTSSSTGPTTTTTSLATKAQLNQGTNLEATIGHTQSSTGPSTTTLATNSTGSLLQTKTESSGGKNAGTLAANMQVDQNTSLKASVGTDSTQNKTIGLEANQRVDDKRAVTSSINVTDSPGGKTTTINLTNTSRLNQELQAVAERSFGFSNAGGVTRSSKYGLVRDQNGHKLEGSITQQYANKPTEIDRSNIFGLTGDVNDRLALLTSIEKGKVQNLDGSQTDRMAYSIGAGYVLKDTVTAEERIKDSTKLELRLDRSNDHSRQYVIYNEFSGKLTDNLTLNSKIDFSNTKNTTTNSNIEHHKEIVMGLAYRPINVDNLNLIGRYTYKENQSPGGTAGQATQDDVQQDRMQVFAAEAVYDLNEKWQLVENLAYRINEEQVTGFDFTRTHTWLMVHRINYHIDPNWTLGGEYRRLTQVEAKDFKEGVLLELSRYINENAQLGIGWNFTHFSDDLTNLNYATQGPFLRMSGQLYDRTPEEKARARAKWIDQKVDMLAWTLVKKELSKKDSQVVAELNRMFALAQQAQKGHHFEQSKEIYKNIIQAGQIMYEEAAEYIRSQIAFEEKLQQYDKTAQEYFRSGEYEKAGKLWEKIVEDAQVPVVK